MLLLILIPVLISSIMLSSPFVCQGTIYLTGVSLCMSTILAWSQYATSSVTTVVLPLFSIYTYSFTLNLGADATIYLLLSMLGTVSTAILMYTVWYSGGDPLCYRLMQELTFFTFSMQLVMTSADLITLFTSWELIGISSFLLIGYYTDRSEALRSSLKATLYNRVGDVTLLAACCVLLSALGDTSMDLLSLLVSMSDLSVELWTAISLCLVVSAWAKSAQLGLHVWLLDAMEGPTPVSSLLHSATLVTAGIVVLFKTECIWSTVPSICILITILGVASALTACMTAIFYWDSKRIIAYSTCTHIALMFVCLGIGHSEAAIEHLYVHGWSKSLLFMLTGMVIHSVHTQDVRLMSPISRLLPLVSSMCIITILSLQGTPGSMLADSKDWMLSTATLTVSCSSLLLLIVAIVWCSQGYSLGVFVSCWTEQNINVPKVPQSTLGLVAPLLLLCLNVVYLPLLSGDYLQSSHLGVLDTAELLPPSPILEPLGACVLLGLATGTLSTSSSVSTVSVSGNSNSGTGSSVSMKAESTKGVLPVSLPVVISAYWNRLFVDKLWNSLALYLSVTFNKSLQGNLEQGFLVAVLSPIALFRQPMSGIRLSVSQVTLPMATIVIGILMIL
eukprot:NODE_89_length_2649_cov_5242.539231_g58_i0.p1 GENE.NODE_89_length_2649_cov_5242.539231_g58_i0~~NODE_89_length_2649_cov_5242.539231_g58_i0.p1  ORF type:complete len:618 (-),score=-86.91 NODE_89_length_2649_cov_5242.539231_g58_i0:129-1982(-)